MSRYAYIVKPQPDRTIRGTIEAETEQEAVNKLNQMGYFILSLKNEDLSLSRNDRWRFLKISNKDIVLFTRQLSSLIESGVNILNSLNIIYNQIQNKYFKAIVGEVSARIRDGASLSEAFATHPEIFPALYTALIKTGEASGNLSKSLSRLADFQEKEEAFRSSLRSSLVYPFFVFSIGLVTVGILLVFVIPRMVTMFEDMGQVLPMPTLILIRISNLLQHYWVILLAVFFALIFFFKRFSRLGAGKMIIDRAKLKMIGLGPIILKAEIGRLMRTLSLLLSSGIAIITALEVAAEVVQNEVLKDEMEGFKQEITAGAQLSSCFKESALLPEFVSSIVVIGEQTGDLPNSLLRIANDYEKDVETFTTNFVRLLEPIIILVLGVVVGFIVLSMLLPIFQINLMVR